MASGRSFAAQLDCALGGRVQAGMGCRCPACNLVYHDLCAGHGGDKETWVCCDRRHNMSEYVFVPSLIQGVRAGALRGVVIVPG